MRSKNKEELQEEIQQSVRSVADFAVEVSSIRESSQVVGQAGAGKSKREQYLDFFKETTEKMYLVTKAKNADYTGALDDPFANFKMVEEMGIASTEQGFLTRMTDKLMRINSFVQNGELQVKDESVEDTLQDLAVYSILFLAYLKLDKYGE